METVGFPSPGCVLIEELFYANEEVHPTSCEKIMRTRSTVDGWSELQRHLDKLRASMSVDGAGPIRAKIKEIVPPSGKHCTAPIALAVFQHTADRGWKRLSD